MKHLPAIKTGDKAALAKLLDEIGAPLEAALTAVHAGPPSDETLRRVVEALYGDAPFTTETDERRWALGAGLRASFDEEPESATAAPDVRHLVGLACRRGWRFADKRELQVLEEIEPRLVELLQRVSDAVVAGLAAPTGKSQRLAALWSSVAATLD